jgi:CheY-like chemotaxis protein
VNLIGNALKFTKPGDTITLRMKQGEIDRQRCRVHFEVEDSGIGIAPDVQGQIFEAFSQADSSITRQYGGTGLGLAISRSLVSILGGPLTVKSSVGAGSIFAFTIPLRLSGQSAVQNIAFEADDSLPSPSTGYQVLLAEDNRVNQTLITKILEKQNHHVTLAMNGKEVIEQLRNGQFDIVLMDIQMPQLSGDEATRIIRDDPSIPYVPIIALTAHAMQEDKDRCLAAGMDAYLTKPLKSKELFQAIDSLVHKS